MTDPQIAELLGIDLDDPEVRRESEAIERDMRLIETLVRLRRARGLTQAQVAERMGRSQPAVSDFERLGGDPHLSTIRRYALAVGADVSHLVRASDELPARTRAASPARIRLDGEGGTTAARGTTGGVVSLDFRQAAG
ncbi:helix-turn-helix domain-containing protein [Streptosporangium sp. CA-135522]|uniref:helix-turn-helix domain-containing protein n=1 Tax=Streptosporangium sp. CA-135522 TaxID=3240072 RepID=UPI003D907875